MLPGLIRRFDTVNEVREWFAHHLEVENQKIYQMGRDEAYKGMGTTLEALQLLIIKLFMLILEILVSVSFEEKSTVN